MCGVAGGWWADRDSSGSPSVPERLREALQAMRYRGPDDEGVECVPLGGGVAALGHVRLAIIDLSAAGHQPMYSLDRRWILVFNGEIYNYRELRAELRVLGRSFATDTDTEVLLAAWMQWGAACLPRLTGMFAFAVLDVQSATLTCVRDAFGIKPFFYTQQEGGFRFASELPALLPLVTAKPQLNWQRAYDYLVQGDYDTTADTFYQDIQHLPAGHCLSVDLRTSQVGAPQRWWTPPVTEAPGWTFDEAVARVREQFLHDVRLHLRSDVPLGVALSGGVDSSAVVCAMAHLEPDRPLHTFSFTAAGSPVDESHWMDRVNAQVGAVPHRIVLSGQDLARDLDDMIRVQGEPFGSTSIYAQYAVFRRARECGMSVVLDGQGADEVLGGYDGFPGQRLRSLIETGRWIQAGQFLRAWARWPGRSLPMGVKSMVGQWAHGRVYEALRALNGERLQPAWLRMGPLREHGVQVRFSRARPVQTARGRRLVAELAHALSERGLVQLLRHADRNSMRFSVESRVPFLTLDMAHLLLSMPEHYLVSPQGETKHVFRAAMRGIVPDDVLDRKDKIGFVTPEQAWLMSMADTVRQWLDVDLKLPFIDHDQVLQTYEQVVAGKVPFSWQVWRWVNFYRWHAEYLG